TVGKPEVDHAGWILDDIMSADEQPGSAGSRGAHALTQPVRLPTWATRRMGSSRPVTAESAAEPPPGSGTSPAARTEMLRVLPPKPPTAAQSGTAAPAKPTFTPNPAFTAKAASPPKAPPRPPAPQGPVLPVPPRDDEKFRYVR